MSKSNNLGDFLTGIADAIRAKTGSSALIDPQDFETEIANLPTGGDSFAKLVDRSITEVTAEDLDGVTSIGERSFFGCASLANITIPNSVTSIGAYAFQSCTAITSITIPDSVTSIGNQTFYDCSSLTYVILSKNITSIPSSCFGSTSISSINIPNGVTNIDNSAFVSCASLRAVTLPSAVASIGSAAFRHCTSLNSITILAITPPTLVNESAFDDTNNCPIYVPSGSVSAYQSNGQWSYLPNRFTRIQAITFSNVSWDAIRQIARSGNASNYFAVGDTKTVTLTNGSTMTVRIADMTTGRYDFADNSGNKSNMVIEFVDCFANTAPMNATNTNAGGWADSAMRSTTMTACLALLPQDMQDAMSEVFVLSGTGNSSTSGTYSSANKLFLPCEYEIFSEQKYSIGSSEAGSSGQFEYYTDASANPVKQRDGTPQVWWLRSPKSESSTNFCVVNTFGSAYNNNSSNQLGVAPVFAI